MAIALRTPWVDRVAPLWRHAVGTHHHPAPAVLNVAHRGASEAAPENTLEAIRFAAALGADVVEVDVHRTADGVLVVLHDNNLLRTTNVRRVFPLRGSVEVRDFAFADVRRLDAGEWKGQAYRGAVVPTLEEVVHQSRLLGLGLLIEVKSPKRYPGIADDVLAVLRRDTAWFAEATIERKVAVQSFDHAWVRRLAVDEPRLPVGLLGTTARADLAEVAEWADLVNPCHLMLDREYVDAVHAVGLRCIPWTVNRGSTLRKVLALGVDGVITNRPHALRALIESPRRPAA